VHSDYIVLGGAGFIGSHFVEKLLSEKRRVLVVDDYSAGFYHLLDKYKVNKDLEIVNLDIRNTEKLASLIHPTSKIIHLASNPDIAAAATNPRIDFINGTVLTESVVEAARIAGAKEIMYASGSGVYGELVGEDFKESDEMMPISPYGASKLAGEALLSAYAHMFEIKTTCFRFANVVGPNQTHGVGYDFVKRLKSNPFELHILGDGQQRKSYIHVSDVIEAVLNTTNTEERMFDTFNVSTEDQVSVNEIAEIVFAQLGVSTDSVKISYSGGRRGWSGDVPNVVLNSEKLQRTGWQPKFNSRLAIESSVSAMVQSAYE
jgi:UDP-glucose 4-epimerase